MTVVKEHVYSVTNNTLEQIHDLVHTKFLGLNSTQNQELVSQEQAY